MSASSNSSSNPTTVPPHMIRHYSESVIVFNLVSAKRLKRDGQRSAETWRDHEDHRLVLRVRLQDGLPWMLGHCGYREAFSSSIFASAMQNRYKREVVHVALRTWTGRKGLPISRKYILTFHSAVEAECFTFNHNLFLGLVEEEEDEEAVEEEVVEVEVVEVEDEEDEEDGDILDVQKLTREEEDMLIWDAEDTQDPFPDYRSD